MHFFQIYQSRLYFRKNWYSSTYRINHEVGVFNLLRRAKTTVNHPRSLHNIAWLDIWISALSHFKKSGIFDDDCLITAADLSQTKQPARFLLNFAFDIYSSFSMSMTSSDAISATPSVFAAPSTLDWLCMLSMWCHPHDSIWIFALSLVGVKYFIIGMVHRPSNILQLAQRC